MMWASVHLDAVLPHSASHTALSSVARQFASPKKDSAAPFSSARLLATGSTRLLTVAFSSVAAPHLPPSRAALCSSPHSARAVWPTRPTLQEKVHLGTFS
jgi:hypothetical protein